MSTRTFNISALSPILRYAPQQDLTHSVWKSDEGGLTNNNANTGTPQRILQGTGTVTVTAFGSGLGFAGSFTGVYCSYTATLSQGPGNSQTSSYTFPAPQTSPPSTGMLASFTGLPFDNWSLTLKGDCDNGSMIKVSDAVVEGWVGAQDGVVSTRTLDDTSTELNYSGVDWSDLHGLRAAFYNDTQHYTSSSNAVMNFTFSGSALIVWSSIDGSHGPYSATLLPSSSASSFDPTTLVPSTTTSTLVSSGYNPFLAVPVPYYFATGLDPTQNYTLFFENRATNGTYLDLDYIEVYTSTGGGPPNGGNAVIRAAGGSFSPNLNVIIGAAVGGGVGAILLLLLLWWCWRRRKIKVQRESGGTRPLPFDRSSTGHALNSHLIALQMHSQGRPVLPVPYSAHDPYASQYTAERQGLLHDAYSHNQGTGTGMGSPPANGGTGTGTGTGTFSQSGSSSGYDPYAAFGGGYPSPHSASYTALVSSVPADPVQVRRQGKAAEIDAARERMRVANNGSLYTAMSPTTPGGGVIGMGGVGSMGMFGVGVGAQPSTPHQTHSTVSQSWDASSQGPSTPGPTSVSGKGGANVHHTGDVKTPEEPPPKYEQQP